MAWHLHDVSYIEQTYQPTDIIYAYRAGLRAYLYFLHGSSWPLPRFLNKKNLLSEAWWTYYFLQEPITRAASLDAFLKGVMFLAQNFPDSENPIFPCVFFY